MTWNDQMSAQVDKQHMKLNELLNNFHDAMKMGKGKEAMGKTFSELLPYTAYRSVPRKTSSQKCGCPASVAHKKEREALTKQAMDLNERFSRGEPIISAETMTFLKNWLHDHILGSDKKFGPFLNAKGVR